MPEIYTLEYLINHEQMTYVVCFCHACRRSQRIAIASLELPLTIAVDQIATPCKVCRRGPVRYVPAWEAPPRPRPVKVTVGHILRDQKYTRLLAYCDRCLHRRAVGIVTLMALYGVRETTRLDEIEAMLRCMKCGRKEVDIRDDPSSRPPAWNEGHTYIPDAEFSFDD